MDIKSIVDRNPLATSPGRASNSSRSSRRNSSPKDDTTGPISTSSVTSISTPASLPRLNVGPQQLPRVSELMPGAYYPPAYSATPPNHDGPASHYQPFHPIDARLPGPIPITYAPGHGQKRLAQQPHPAESPAKKQQSKWSAEEDRLITELRGNGMK